MLRRVNLWLLHGSLLVVLQGCGGCGEDDPPATRPIDRDSGTDEQDPIQPDAGDPPIDVPDASDIYPGEPPEELAGEPCAAHTNKIYELATTSGNAQPAQLSAFGGSVGMTYVATDDVMCATALRYAEMHGPPGAYEPTPMMAYDDCTLIEQAAIAHGDDVWLLGIVDNRQEARDLWVHAFNPESGRTRQQRRITENMAGEGAVELLRIDNDKALIVWAETAFDDSSRTSLHAQFLSGAGEPLDEPIEIAEATDGYYTSMAMALLGEFYIGLVYIHDDGAGGYSAVLDVLNRETAERDRDPWVITATPGTNGTIDIGSDSMGAGVAYTLADGTSRQVWFQKLGLDGRAASVVGSGGMMGGPSDPLRIVENPLQAIDISMARLPRGYVIAYRALPSVGVASPQIRVHFIDRDGRIVGDSAVALAELGGGQTAIKMASDGRRALSWMDTDDEGNSTLRSLILPCEY